MTVRILHDAVQLVEVPRREAVQRHLPKPRPDRLVDLRPVGAKRRRREVETFTLVEPLVDELAKGCTDAVRSSWRLLIHEVSKGVVRRPGAAVEGLG